MKKILYLGCALVSLVLYYNAPREIDFIFNFTCFLIFLIQAFAILKEDIRKDGMLTVNVIFLFSFFWVSYAFPLLILGTPKDTREGIEAYIDFSVSCKCSALCSFAISMYFFAYKRHQNNYFDFSKLVRCSDLGLVNAFYYVFFVVMFYEIMNHMRDSMGVAVHAGYWTSLYLASVPLVLVNNCHKHNVKTFGQYVKNNLGVLLSALFLIILYLIIGDRGPAIIIGVSIVAVYSFMVKEIRPAWFLAGIVLGSFLMYAIRVTRTSESSLGSGNTEAFAERVDESMSTGGAIGVFSDLIGIHRELYFGYEYYEQKGLIEPMQWVIVPFYPIPLLPNAISQKMFGKTMDEIKPAVMLNQYVAYTGHGHFGVHSVIDIFMRWGIIGVVVFFYFWGYLVASLSRSKTKNILGLSLYVLLIASAIRIPRAPMLDMMRLFFYVLFLAWLASLFAKKRNFRKILRSR